MASVADWLVGLFAFLGVAGTLVALFLVFVIDAAIIPLLPELAIVLSFLYRGPGVNPFLWALLLLSMAVSGEVIGNTLMFLWVRKLVVDRGHLPRILDRAMRSWTRFLVVPDERIILVNRIAPVVPFVGAFIAVLRWNYAKSILFIVLGAAAKYSLLLVLAAYLGLIYDPNTATLVTIAAIIVLVAVSAGGSLLYRRSASAPRVGRT
jgi:hypothetical protein